MSFQNRLLSLFRIFFPSWKFFDAVGSLPQLLYQIESDTHSWIPAWTDPKMNWTSLFLNAEKNLAHAYSNLVNQLMLEVQELNESAIENSVSYQLVENLVRHQILKKNPSASGKTFCFKISIQFPEACDALISGKHEV